MTAALLAARLRAAVAASRVHRRGGGPGSQAGDATGAVDALIRALADEPCAFVIDDAHHAAPDAGALIDHIATRLEGEQRLARAGPPPP